MRKVSLAAVMEKIFTWEKPEQLRNSLCTELCSNVKEGMMLEIEFSIASNLCSYQYYSLKLLSCSYRIFFLLG